MKLAQPNRLASRTKSARTATLHCIHYTESLSVTGDQLLFSTALQKLRLDGALALLGEKQDAASQDTPESGLQRLQSIIDGLCELSLRDPLTGCANRRHFDSVLDRELDRVARSGDVALLLMVDIDHFKQVNDRHGHLAGDAVLQHVAQALSHCIRPMDTLARYGGEEFAIVLPACQPAYGQSVAERVRQTVNALRVPIDALQTINVTVSIGGAYALQWIRSTCQLWLERADQHLYLAKSAGRNRIEIEQQPDSTVTAEEKNLLFIPELYTESKECSAEWFEALSVPTEITTDAN